MAVVVGLEESVSVSVCEVLGVFGLIYTSGLCAVHHEALKILFPGCGSRSLIRVMGPQQVAQLIRDSGGPVALDTPALAPCTCLGFLNTQWDHSHILFFFFFISSLFGDVILSRVHEAMSGWKRVCF